MGVLKMRYSSRILLAVVAVAVIAATAGVTVLAWRYAGGERSLAVSVETVAPEVTVSERSLLSLSPAGAQDGPAPALKPVWRLEFE